MTDPSAGTCRALIVGVGQAQTLTIERGDRGEPGLYRFDALAGVASDVATYDRLIPQLIQPPMMLQRTILDEPDETSPQRILTSLGTLVDETAERDVLVLVLVGHGMTVPDKDGDEREGNPADTLDEAFVATGGIIVDDEFQVTLKEVPSSAMVLQIADCCSADSVFKGPAPTSSTSTKVEPAPADIAPQEPDDGPVSISIFASASWGTAKEIRYGQGKRGALTSGLHTQFRQSPEQDSLAGWFQRTSDWVQQMTQGRQVPLLRYRNAKASLLDLPPTIGALSSAERR